MAFLIPDKTDVLNGVTVKEYLLTKHNPNRIDMPTVALPAKPIGITIHNTDWIVAANGTHPSEQYSRATVNGNMNDVRVHYYVDNVCAWQTLPLSLSGWHAADGGGDGNRKTISIECIMSSSYNDTDKKSEDNCAKLAAYLLHKYGLNVDEHLYTHTHWLNVRDGIKGSNDYLNTHKHPYKWCPLYILPHWTTFKEKVRTYLNALNKTSTSPIGKPASGKIEPSIKEIYRVRKSWQDAASQIGAYSNLENAKKACKEGYNVYNSKGNVIYSVPVEHCKADIIGLQKILNIGGAGLVVDGIVGNKTLSAVKKYTVESGDTGNLIKWVQNRLSQLGYNCGIADGVAGQRTMGAIYEWQKAHNLGVGYLGGGDWDVLLR